MRGEFSGLVAFHERVAKFNQLVIAQRPAIWEERVDCLIHHRSTAVLRVCSDGVAQHTGAVVVFATGGK